MLSLKEFDPELYEAIRGEREREEKKLELIASENFVSLRVLEAQGSILTHKYAEGYPGRRYYGGCEFVDIAENLAIERAKAIFGAEHVNAQPHSGSQANMAVYLACLNMGDSMLGMNLSHGGHLTHGSPVNFSGKWFKVVPYGVRKEDQRIDYEEVERLAEEHRPKMIMVGASAYPREIDFSAFSQIVKKVGAYLVVDMAHIAGLIAAKIHPSPIPYADFVTTTTHKTLRGPRGGMILCQDKYKKIIDSTVFPGIQGGPLMHVIAAKAVALKEAMEPSFREYQHRIVNNAKALASQLISEGFDLVSGGTDTHLMLVDLTRKGLTGKEAEEALDKAGITVNKNTIPFESRSPFITSGIRIGTPAVTTRGMREGEMKLIARMISEVLADPKDSHKIQEVREEVGELCSRFPLFQDTLVQGYRIQNTEYRK